MENTNPSSISLSYLLIVILLHRDLLLRLGSLALRPHVGRTRKLNGPCGSVGNGTVEQLIIDTLSGLDGLRFRSLSLAFSLDSMPTVRFPEVVPVCVGLLVVIINISTLSDLSLSLSLSLSVSLFRSPQVFVLSSVVILQPQRKHHADSPRQPDILNVHHYVQQSANGPAPSSRRWRASGCFQIPLQRLTERHYALVCREPHIRLLRRLLGKSQEHHQPPLPARILMGIFLPWAVKGIWKELWLNCPMLRTEQCL